MNKEITTVIDSYLSFKMGDEIFAVNVSKVLEILELRPMTKVPKSPEYMRGVINLRGSVLPVIDTRIKFGMPATVDSLHTCIMVLDILVDDEKMVIGALVDEVQEVMEIDESTILDAPSFGLRYRSDIIQGMLKADEQFIMVLNIDQGFTAEDLLITKANSPE